jgi:histidinol phosphatase-like PHP family hydrolase
LKSKFVDILAHPGLITEEEVKLAGDNNKFLEITSRKGHSITNGYVAKIAGKYNVNLVLNTDAHAPEDLIDLEFGKTVLKGAGIKNIESVLKNSEIIVEKILN